MSEEGMATAQEFGTTPYQTWAQGEGIPINHMQYHPDLNELEVTHWPRMGQNGAFVIVDELGEDDGYLLELTPGGHTEVQHHCFEALIYVLSGRGATSFWQKDGKRQSVEWQRGSLFAPPMNCYYQHFNVDGQQPARLFVITSAPSMLNLVRNPDFVFDNDFVFRDRYDGQDEFWSSRGERVGNGAMWKTNFIPDVRQAALESNMHRGPAQRIMHYVLAGNAMMAHCSEFGVGGYKRAHRHGGGAHIIMLEGHGYSYLHFEGEDELRPYEWKDGTLLCPKELEFHQHFNLAPTPGRDIALRMSSLGTSNRRWSTSDNILGIAFEEEPPAVYEAYVKACTANGVEVTMPRPNYGSPPSSPTRGWGG